MVAYSVAPCFKLFEQVCASLLSGSAVNPVNTLSPKDSEVALDDSIIESISGTAHGCPYAMCLQLIAEISAWVLVHCDGQADRC